MELPFNFRSLAAIEHFINEDYLEMYKEEQVNEK